MIEQGIKISTWGKNAYVKIPVVNSKNKFTGDVIKKLNNIELMVNLGICFNTKFTI